MRGYTEIGFKEADREDVEWIWPRAGVSWIRFGQCRVSGEGVLL
jgi:hypothetical protein